MGKMIVGICGSAGAGKDTVRTILTDYGYDGCAFADPLRDMVSALFSAGSITKEYMTNREMKESIIPEIGVSYREIMQTLGTEWGRSLNANLWLDIVKSKIEKSAWDKFVISDVRFPNEADWVLSQGGHLVYIDRNVPAVRSHASEISLRDRATYILDNNGGIGALSSAVALMADTLNLPILPRIHKPDYKVMQSENWIEP